MSSVQKPIHKWWKTIRVSVMPSGIASGPSAEVVDKLKAGFSRNLHLLSAIPSDNTDVAIATRTFGETVPVHRAPTFELRRDYRLNSPPSIVLLAHATTQAFEQTIARLTGVLSKPYVDPSDYRYPGLSPEAYKVLSEQGRRGGPILALARILQAQLKCIRIVLFVGDRRPSRAYHFDLVGSTACTRLLDSEEAFYDDVVRRIATTVSARQVTEHAHSDVKLPLAIWNGLRSVQAMCHAGEELDRRRFFTHAVQVSDLIDLPTVSEGVARQYSEGCYATWDASIQAQIATITGAAKVLHKGDITRHDLVPLARINDARNGVLYPEVEGKDDHPPSSEAFELLVIDEPLPRILCPVPGHGAELVPVIRSKLHGHRGIKSYDPTCVEYAPLDEAYFHYPVTCGSEAQALGLRDAFARAQSLRNPDDPRSVVFTILPCHGVFIVEKWRNEKEPFQLMWEYMDRGAIRVEDAIPQGPIRYEMGPAGHLTLESSAPPSRSRPHVEAVQARA